MLLPEADSGPTKGFRVCRVWGFRVVGFREVVGFRVSRAFSRV